MFVLFGFLRVFMVFRVFRVFRIFKRIMVAWDSDKDVNAKGMGAKEQECRTT